MSVTEEFLTQAASEARDAETDIQKILKHLDNLHEDDIAARIRLASNTLRASVESLSIAYNALKEGF